MPLFGEQCNDNLTDLVGEGKYRKDWSEEREENGDRRFRNISQRSYMLKNPSCEFGRICFSYRKLNVE